LGSVAVAEKIPIEVPNVNMPEPKTETRLAHCPNCGPKKNALVRGEYKKLWESEDGPVFGAIEYRLLQCGGCDSIYFETSSTCSEDGDYQTNPYTGEEEYCLIEKREYWPSPCKRPTPTWASKLYSHDYELGALFEEIFQAANSGMSVLAAIGIRTAFDLGSSLLGVKSSLTFGKKLDELLAQGKISTHEKDILEVLIDAGNAAAHRAWRPKEDEVNALLDTLEAFLNRTIILGDTLSGIKKNIPPKKP